MIISKQNGFINGLMANIVMGLCCAVFLLPVLDGCAAQKGNFGLVVASREIGQQFKQNPETFPEDYKWYYTGSPGNPLVLIGISSAYRLDTDRWKNVAAGEASISRMVTLINNNNGQYKFTNFGSRIEGPQKEQIGVWYSPMRRTTVAFPDDKTVKIAIPKKQSKKRMHND